jgi:hypothetical protein
MARMRGAILALWVLAATVTAAEAPLPAQAPPLVVEPPAGTRVGAINIKALQIFNTSDPAENRALFRLANRLHYRTRESVLRAQLLFASGDLYSERLRAETERNLRELHFLREPKVRLSSVHDGVAEVEVESHDVWTLQLGPSFSRSGGKNSTGLSFEDKNLLGYGKTLIVGAASDVDRKTTTVEWRDPAVRNGRWRDDFYWSNNSDGRAWRASVWRPFYSLDTRRAYGVMLGNGSALDNRYRLGESYDSYRHALAWLDAYLGWSRGLQSGRTLRLTGGLALQHDEFRTEPGVLTLAPLPRNRRLSYPYLRVDWLRDDFRTSVNLDLIARTEDLQYGFNANLLLGATSRRLDSDRDALLVNAGASYGRRLSDQRQYFLQGTLRGRVEHGRGTDQRWSASAAWYQRTSARTLLHARVTASGGSALDLDHFYELGGDTGLRGYPLRYQLGSGLTLFKLEERLYTPWNILRLLDVGAAAFVDVGRVHGRNPLGVPQLGWLRDAGVGLRLGNSRSSLGNVIHIDIATPLDGERRIDRWQLLVSTEATF